MARATQQNKDTHQCIVTERLQGRSIQKIECDNFFKYKTASNSVILTRTAQLQKSAVNNTSNESPRQMLPRAQHQKTV